MLPPLDRLERPQLRALRLIRRIAAGWLGSGEDLHVEQLGPRMAASLTQALDPLFAPVLGDWQAETARALVRLGSRQTVSPVLAAMGRWLDVPPRFRNQAKGPRDYPVLNWMDSVMADLTRQRIPAGDLNVILDALWDQLADASKALQAEADPLRNTRGLAGCREALAGLQQLDDFLTQSRPEQLEEGYNRFLAGYAILDEVYLDAAAQELATRPTPCPLVNWLVMAVLATDEDVLEPIFLARAASAALTTLSGSFYGLEGSLTHFYGGPAALLKQVDEAREALDRLCGELISQRLEPAVMESAGEILGRAHRALGEAGGGAGQLVCAHCGSLYTPTAKICPSCHAAVGWYSAQASIDAEAEETGQSSFLRQLVDGCEQLQSDLISGPQFAGLLRSAYQRLQQAQKAQGRLPDMEPFGFQVLGARQMLGTGLDGLAQALELLHEYLVDHKLGTLSKAVRQLVAAGRQLEQVRDL